MKSIFYLLSDLKEHKFLLLGITMLGALASLLKASTASLAKVMGDLIFKDSLKEDLVLKKSSFVLSQINDLAESLQTEPLYIACVLLALTFIVANFLRYFFNFNLRVLAESKAVQTREKLMRHYLHLSSKEKLQIREGSGSLMSRILNDVGVYQAGIRKLSDLLKEPFLVLFSALWLFSLNWKVALLLFVGFPPVLIILRRFSKSLRKHSEKSQKTMEELTMTLKEGLDGSRVIYSFNLENKILAKFKKQTQVFLKTIKKIISREELSGPITESISSIVFCLSFLLIAYLVKAESLSFGDFFGISVAIGFLTDSSRKSQSAFIRTQQANVAKERIDGLLSIREEKKQSPGSGVSFPKNLTSIQVENLRVEIDSKKILNGISASFSAGKTIALVGPSGSGKTTFLNCLDGYIKANAGRLLFNGVSVDQIDSADLRKNISLVSQDPFLFNGTVYENLQLIQPDLTEEQAVEALQLANAHFVFKRPKGIHSEVGERGSFFSGGEKQRISIARALIKNSPILLLDEATSALDTQSEIEVQKGLSSLREGRTCFVVAHRLSTIKDSDLILVFEKGQIVESGTHQDLLSQAGLYSSLYKSTAGSV